MSDLLEMLEFAKKMGKQCGEAQGRFKGYLRGKGIDITADGWKDWGILNRAFEQERWSAYQEAQQAGIAQGAKEQEEQ